MVGSWGRVGLFILSAVVMGSNVGVLRLLWGVVNGWEVQEKRKEQEERGAGNGREPQAVRQLRSSVNGTPKRRENIVGNETKR